MDIILIQLARII